MDNSLQILLLIIAPVITWILIIGELDMKETIMLNIFTYTCIIIVLFIL